MGTKNPAFDAYIDRSADFAKPILRHLRELVHTAVPEVEEEMKWNNPSFMYKGMLCGMAAFKQHCMFGFWKGSLILDKKRGKDLNDQSMTNYGRFAKLSDLPPDKVLLGYLKEAKRLNDQGVKVPKAPKRPATEVVVPPYFMTAIRKNKAALKTFQAFSPTNKREYVEWITEAKTDATRSKRIETAVAWMAEGKPRMWKYMRKP